MPRPKGSKNRQHEPTVIDGGIDFTKRCVVPMSPLGRAIEDGDKGFDIIVYGRTAEELMTVPNAVIGSISRRHRDHQSSIWELYNLGDARPPWARSSVAFDRFSRPGGRYASFV